MFTLCFAIMTAIGQSSEPRCADVTAVQAARFVSDVAPSCEYLETIQWHDAKGKVTKGMTCHLPKVPRKA